MRTNREHLTKQELKDNPIKDFIILLLTFFRKYSREILITLSGVILAVIIFSIVAIVFSVKTKSSLEYFEIGLAKYEKISEAPKDDSLTAVKISPVQKARNALQAFQEAEKKSIGKYKNLSILYQGHCHIMLREYSKAVSKFKKYIKKSGNKLLKPFVMRELGIGYEELGETEKAIQIYKDIQKKYPDSSVKTSLFLDIARCYKSMGKYDLSEEYYNKIIEFSPESVWVENAKKGLVLLKLEKKAMNTQ